MESVQNRRCGYLSGLYRLPIGPTIVRRAEQSSMFMKADPPTNSRSFPGISGRLATAAAC
ncbi:hypothetical protein HBB04_00888 [Pseudomonas coronafaciens]|nr:hypothetical protein HBB04_00888 [Pseudomonas coronafaciens]